MSDSRITEGRIRYSECIRVGAGPERRQATAEVSFFVPHGHGPARYLSAAAAMAQEKVRAAIGWKAKRGRPPKHGRG
jgi:hypothetical protein